MNNTPKQNSLWRVCGPFLLYWGVQVIAQVIVSCILVFFNSEEIAGAYTALSANPTEAEMNEVITNVMTMMMDIVMKYYVEITAFTALCTIPVMYLFFRKDRKQEIKASTPLNLKAPAKQYLWIPVLGTALCLGFNCLIIMTNLAFLSESYQETSSLFYSASFLVQIVGIGLVVPIAEELLFRGIIFKRFRETTGFKWSAICSAIIFAVIHSSMLQLIYTFILGMFLAYVYEKYGSFKAPVILHVCVNIVSIICTELQILDLLYAIPMIMAVTIVVCAFVGSVMFLQIQKIQEKPVIQNEAE